MVLLLVFALFPGIALRRVDAYLNQLFPEGGLGWTTGNTITSTYGYWNPIAIMISVVVIFGTLFAWLLFVDRKAQKVKQFNIVFSAERPFRPETTHFAWNFFAPYRKALGFLVTPLASASCTSRRTKSWASSMRRVPDASPPAQRGPISATKTALFASAASIRSRRVPSSRLAQS